MSGESRSQHITAYVGIYSPPQKGVGHFFGEMAKRCRTLILQCRAGGGSDGNKTSS
jgi:hypothetical protein